MGSWIALGLLVLAGLVLVLWHDGGTIGGLDPSDLALVISGLAVAVFVGFPLLREYRGRAREVVRDVVVWAALGLGLVAIYGFRDELKIVAARVVDELSPAGADLGAEAASEGEQAVRLRRRTDGHFVARTLVDGTQITMLVDTGASSIILKSSDAQRIGFNTASLAYTVPVQTANGTAFAAPIRLKSISVGTLGFANVEALVTQPGALEESLLGMSFLSKLGSYEFSGDYLTLRSGHGG
jgi:aspartyl protease family protein